MLETELFDHLRGNWGWVALRGVAALIFGILAFVWPAATLLVLALFWGAYVFCDGIFSLVAGFRMRDQGKPMWSLLLIGVLGIAAGLITFFAPGITAVALLVFIAVWAILMGIFQVVTAIRVRKTIDHEWLLIVSGVVSILFGLVLLFSPAAGLIALVWVVGGYAVVFGLLQIGVALRLRKLGPQDRLRPAHT